MGVTGNDGELDRQFTLVAAECQPDGFTFEAHLSGGKRENLFGEKIQGIVVEQAVEAVKKVGKVAGSGQLDGGMIDLGDANKGRAVPQRVAVGCEVCTQVGGAVAPQAVDVGLDR